MYYKDVMNAKLIFALYVKKSIIKIIILLITIERTMNVINIRKIILIIVLNVKKIFAFHVMKNMKDMKLYH